MEEVGLGRCGGCTGKGVRVWGTLRKVWVYVQFVRLLGLQVPENDCSLSGTFSIWGVSADGRHSLLSDHMFRLLV